jgi:uncharacterized membrane protein YqjE
MEIIDDNNNNDQTTMSVGDWALTIFLSGLPLIGLILLFIWSFGDNQKAERINWAKATLIWYLIMFVIGGFFFMLFGAAMLAGVASEF